MKEKKKNDNVDYPLNIQRVNHIANRELLDVHVCPCCGQPMNINDYGVKVWGDE